MFAIVHSTIETPKGISSRATVAGLVLLCALLSLFRWGKMDSLWGDQARWIFEAYRMASGEMPYRDFAWQYPPFALLLFGAALAVFGIKFAVVQGLLDILSTAVVLLVWDAGRRFLPNPLAVAAAILVACAGAANPSNFALFSLQMYTPAILTGLIGLLIVIRETADYLRRGTMPARAWIWTAVGAAIALLSKPEFILGVLGCLAGAALADRRLWFAGRSWPEWAGFHTRVFATATIPAAIGYGIAAILCGPANVAAGVGGYGIAAWTCPWWPTGLGMFGALVAIGHGMIAAAVLSLPHARRLWRHEGSARRRLLFLWGAACLSVVVTALYLPSAAAATPVFGGRLTFSGTAAYFLSTGTVLLPVMWIGIAVLAVLIVRLANRAEPPLMEAAALTALLAAGLMMSLRGMFGGTMSPVSQVAVAAYPVWFIAGPLMLLWLLRVLGWGRRAMPAVTAAVLAYALLRIGGAAVQDARRQYASIETGSGTIQLRDREVSPALYSYLLAATSPNEPILDLALGGLVNFAEHRASPLFSTQFTALAPAPRFLQADLERMRKNPPRVIVANEGESFQASYGLCMTTGCTFPALVWRSERLACDPAKPFPALEYVRRHYSQVAKFGEKIVLLREDAVVVSN